MKEKVDMKKPILLFFIFYVWVYALTSCSVLRAEEVKSEKGVCEASGSLDWVELADYDGLFYSIPKRKDRHGSICLLYTSPSPRDRG